MKKNNLGYLLREGVRGVFLHGFMSFAAISVTVACLIIMGSFSLVLYNVNIFVREAEQDNKVLVYIDESYSTAEARSVGSQINMIHNVYNAEFVTREQALENFVAEQSDTDLFQGLSADTLRDRFVITLDDITLMSQTVEELKQIDGVADTVSHNEIAQGFATIQSVLQIASFAIIGVLLVVSLLIISNTVKLSLFDRKEEIAIMRMVGATNGFIRWPFVVQGFILGMLGAAVAFFLEWGIYNFIIVKISSVDSLQLFHLAPFSDVLPLMIAAYTATGLLVGVLGSLLSIRKFLKV